MVGLGRVELPTRSLGNCCSIHLSYSPAGIDYHSGGGGIAHAGLLHGTAWGNVGGRAARLGAGEREAAQGIAFSGQAAIFELQVGVINVERVSEDARVVA